MIKTNKPNNNIIKSNWRNKKNDEKERSLKVSFQQTTTTIQRIQFTI